MAFCLKPSTGDPISRSSDSLIADLTGATPSEVVFWSGAGISLEEPAALPSGWTLTERVAEQLFLPGVLDTARTYYQVLEVRDAWGKTREIPRLEFLLGVAVAVHGTAAFDVLSDMEAVEPNWLHNFYGEHVRLGGTHITANFDTGIERSLSTAASARVTHFHGTYDPRGTNRLGATIAEIQHGFAAATKDMLSETLRTRRYLVVAGYSGSDYFDVDPFFREEAAARSLSGLKVLWIHHSPGADSSTLVDDQFPLPMARSLVRAGAEVWWIDGDTRELHERIASRWSIDVPDPRTVSGSPWRPSIDLGSPEKTAATLQLWHSMGLARETSVLLHAFQGEVPAGRLEVAAMVAWHEGRYRDARRHWKATDRSAPALALHVRERIGATLWASGRLVPAYLALVAAIRYGRRHALDLSVVGETMTRVVEHMARTPELRWLSRVLKASVSEVLSDPSPSQGIHTRTRLEDAHRINSGRAYSDDDLADYVERFAQVESLNGLLNYRHRRLRDRYEAGDDVPDREFRDLWIQKQYIGSIGDAVRLISVPGAERAFTWRELKCGVCQTQLAPWQRVRIIALRASRLWNRRSRP